MFREYFKNVHGISLISEGKIESMMILPATGDQVTLNPILHYYGAYEVNTPAKGIALTATGYRSLINYLNQEFIEDQTITDTSDESFSEYKKKYFSELGVNAGTEFSQKKLPTTHFMFVDAQSKQAFMQKFTQYNPRESYDPINRCESVEMPPGFLDQLMHEYYNENTKLKKKTSQESQAQLTNLIKLRSKIVNGLKAIEDIDRAHKLSLDYENKIDINLQTYEASGAYALSLEIFAEINRDILSDFQYDRLKHAAKMLISFDEKGQLQQSLQMDANFTFNIVYQYQKSAHEMSSQKFKGCPLISELSNADIKNEITNMIAQNTAASLYGGMIYSTSMKRFLPDSQMQSDTDEIVFQGGGMMGHSSMFRIIKVGVLANGEKIPFTVNPLQKPHHYEYYKVESNLGAGCHHPNYPVCMGTYITKLEPFNFDSQTRQYTATKTDPFANPDLYQQEMEVTLQGLISTERYLLFYRPPKMGQNGERSSTPGTPEAIEWERLNLIKQQLSGTQCPFVGYLAKEFSGSIKIFLVNEQLGYMQEEGSCPIFSIKQFVTGIIGGDLNTIHSGFLQANDTEGHLHHLQSKIEILQPTQIRVSSAISQWWMDTFKRYANMDGQPQGLTIEHGVDQSSSTSANPFVMDIIVISDPVLKQKWDTLLEQQTCQFVVNPKMFHSLQKEITRKYFPHDIPGMQILHQSPSEITLNFSDPLLAYFWEHHYKQALSASDYQDKFFKKQQSGLQVLKSLKLAGAHLITSAVIGEDKNKPDSYMVKFTCTDGDGARLLAKSIECYTTNKPGILVDKNEVIVDEARINILFQKLGVDGKKILPNLPEDIIAPPKSNRF